MGEEQVQIQEFVMVEEEKELSYRIPNKSLLSGLLFPPISPCDCRVTANSAESH